GLLALDVEVADLAEVEDALVEVRPLGHVAALDVVGQVIEVGQALGIAGLRLGRAGDRHEVDVIDLLRAIAVDQVEVRAADPLYSWDGQPPRARRAHARARAPLA